MDPLLKAINGYKENEKMDLSKSLETDLTESDKSLTEITQKESTETTLRSPLLVEKEDWKLPDDRYSVKGYYIQDRFMNICAIKEFNHGEKDEIRQIEQMMDESRNYSGPGKHRYDHEFVHAMLDWGFRRARDRESITVKMLLSAINKDENFENWSNPLRKKIKHSQEKRGSDWRIKTYTRPKEIREGPILRGDEPSALDLFLRG